MANKNTATDEKKIQPLSKTELVKAKALLQEFLATLGVQAEIAISNQGELVEVVLDSEETGLLIGYHGETLEALQLISSYLLSKKMDRFIRIAVEVGDYRQNRSAYLEHLAYEVKEKVLTIGREQVISSLKPWERRIIHMLLKEDHEVTSESMGEGRDRVLVVKPRRAS